MCEAHDSRRSEQDAAEVRRLVEEVEAFAKQDHEPVGPHPFPEVFTALDLRHHTLQLSRQIRHIIQQRITFTQWLERRSLTGELSLVSARSVVDV